MSTLFFVPVAHSLAMWTPQGWEWLIIAGFGLLFFGKRLPEVGRSLGKGIVEFKRGLKGVGDDIETESNKPAALPTGSPVAASLPGTDSAKQIATVGDKVSEA